MKRLVLLMLAGCVQMLGGERSTVGDDLECSGDEDCAAGYGCADDDVCRKKCFEDAECGGFRECSNRYCSDAVGTPCDPDKYTSCYGIYNCETVDVENDEVLGYCTKSCYESDPCPGGFTCVASTCLVNDR